jgi:hypothetical protein
MIKIYLNLCVLLELNFSIEPIMDNIIDPNQNFDFSKLTLAQPVGIQGGAYFTKIINNNKPLYIQTTKSLTRQGFVKSGKKYYCDLMFDNNSEVLINWFEKLEDKCQNLIYEKADSWFQNALEMNDVESAFNSIIRIYKSGKYYLVRTNIKNSPNGDPSIKIYNESELPLGISDIKPETNIISILEIQGIKFTSRNFQIEIELKQVMVLNNDPIFESCLIKTSKTQKPEYIKNDTTILAPITNHLEINSQSISTNLNDEYLIDDKEIHLDSLDPLNNSDSLDDLDNLEEETPTVEESVNNIDINIDIEELDIEELNEPKELLEVDLDVNLENNLESITLKKPNQVYFELYKEARNKAKIAKKSAIIAYLEAKNIKKTYMIENLNDSDSDFDAEIDDVSESELEGL